MTAARNIAARQREALKLLVKHFPKPAGIKEQWDAVPVMARVEIVQAAQEAVSEAEAQS